MLTIKRTLLLALKLVVVFSWGTAQTAALALPDSIYTGAQGKFHMQGMAIDQGNKCIYFSFTNKLVKTDLAGNLIGSVTGFSGHLGDVDFNMQDGRIYGSLEYKADAIGKGISNTLGIAAAQENGFYIAIFDGAKIVRPNMDAEKEDLLQTVYLQEPVSDYEATVQIDGDTKRHRYACSGIDGLTFGPSFGVKENNNQYLYVAYGIYGDTTRNDNDYQVILKYDIANWNSYEQPLLQGALHRSGPVAPMSKYFIKTGNTTYGIQNLAYDTHSGNFFAAVYKGKKSAYPNYDLFVVNGHLQPASSFLYTDNKRERVEVLQLLSAEQEEVLSGNAGWHFQWGATGLCPLGDGFFYIAHPNKRSDGLQESTIYKYKWIGSTSTAFKKE